MSEDLEMEVSYLRSIIRTYEKEVDDLRKKLDVLAIENDVLKNDLRCADIDYQHNGYSDHK